MNINKRLYYYRGECTLKDLKRKGIKYELQPTIDIYGDKVYKVIIKEDCRNEKSIKNNI